MTGAAGEDTACLPPPLQSRWQAAMLDPELCGGKGILPRLSCAWKLADRRNEAVAGPLVVVVGLTGCATIPTGPSVMVLPGRGKTFEQFQADNGVCRQWASTQVGTTPGQASTEAGVSSAAIGAASGNPGVGAAIGAGGGALGGTAVGLGSSEAAAGTVQWRYDVAYQQCMYAKGNQIPVAASSAYGVPPPPPPPPH